MLSQCFQNTTTHSYHSESQIDEIPCYMDYTLQFLNQAFCNSSFFLSFIDSKMREHLPLLMDKILFQAKNREAVIMFLETQRSGASLIEFRQALLFLNDKFFVLSLINRMLQTELVQTSLERLSDLLTMTKFYGDGIINVLKAEGGVAKLLNSMPAFSAIYGIDSSDQLHPILAASQKLELITKKMREITDIPNGNLHFEALNSQWFNSDVGHHFISEHVFPIIEPIVASLNTETIPYNTQKKIIEVTDDSKRLSLFRSALDDLRPESAVTLLQATLCYKAFKNHASNIVSAITDYYRLVIPALALHQGGLVRDMAGSTETNMLSQEKRKIIFFSNPEAIKLFNNLQLTHPSLVSIFSLHMWSAVYYTQSQPLKLMTIKKMLYCDTTADNIFNFLLRIQRCLDTYHAKKICTLIEIYLNLKPVNSFKRSKITHHINSKKFFHEKCLRDAFFSLLPDDFPFPGLEILTYCPHDLISVEDAYKIMNLEYQQGKRTEAIKLLKQHLIESTRKDAINKFISLMETTTKYNHDYQSAITAFKAIYHDWCRRSYDARDPYSIDVVSSTLTESWSLMHTETRKKKDFFSNPEAMLLLCKNNRYIRKIFPHLKDDLLNDRRRITLTEDPTQQFMMFKLSLLQNAKNDVIPEFLQIAISRSAGSADVLADMKQLEKIYSSPNQYSLEHPPLTGNDLIQEKGQREAFFQWLPEDYCLPSLNCLIFCPHDLISISRVHDVINLEHRQGWVSEARKRLKSYLIESLKPDAINEFISLMETVSKYQQDPQIGVAATELKEIYYYWHRTNCQMQSESQRHMAPDDTDKLTYQQMLEEKKNKESFFSNPEAMNLLSQLKPLILESIPHMTRNVLNDKPRIMAMQEEYTPKMKFMLVKLSLHRNPTQNSVINFLHALQERSSMSDSIYNEQIERLISIYLSHNQPSSNNSTRTIITDEEKIERQDMLSKLPNHDQLVWRTYIDALPKCPQDLISIEHAYYIQFLYRVNHLENEAIELLKSCLFYSLKPNAINEFCMLSDINYPEAQ